MDQKGISKEVYCTIVCDISKLDTVQPCDLPLQQEAEVEKLKVIIDITNLT